MGRKQYEETIASRDSEIAVLKERISELSAQLVRMRDKEDAIVAALTEAKSTATRVIMEADKRAAEIEDRAKLELESAKEKSAAIIADAEVQAKEITESANKQADEKLARCDSDIEQRQREINELAAHASRVAAQAKAESERFAAYVEKLDVYAKEVQHEEGCVKLESKGMPESYERPADLMRSIYVLQGREIPAEAAENSDTESQGQEKQTEVKENEAVNTAEPEKADEPKKDAEPEKQDAVHIWTVDEIMSSVLADAAAQQPKADSPVADATDKELNALIDDILK